MRNNIGNTPYQNLSNGDNKLGKEKSIEVLNIALEAMQANVLLHPYDIRNYLTLSQLSQAGYTLTGDTKYIGEYGSYLETALTYSPKRQQIIYNLANFYLQIGKTDEAINSIEQTIKDDPKISEGYWRLAYVYRLVGKMDKAIEALKLAENNGIVFNESEQGTIAQILAPAPATTAAKKK
ncbi:MAG: tetratricopeptide repeat protein [Nanoarchaeota archaeon]